MKKCNVCGRRFRLLAKNRYEVVKRPVGFNCLMEGTVYYNAFDCPHCGCQNIVGVFEKVNVRDIKEQPLKSEEQESVLNQIKEEIRDNTYYINELTEKEGIDFETVEKIIDKYKAESEDELWN